MDQSNCRKNDSFDDAARRLKMSLHTRRVLILGCPGSGKSTLGRAIAAVTKLPLIHLDQIYWRPNWVEPIKEEWDDQLARELSKPNWIMDGNYGRTLAKRLQAADAAILLDLPTRTCLLRTCKRVLLGWGQVRTDMPFRCPERFHLALLRYVLYFRRVKVRNF